MKWKLPETSGSGSLLDQLFDTRGILPADRKSFLEPGAQSIHNARDLYDTSSAAKLIITAIQEGKKIFIYGDYDVDGVCATALLWDLLSRKMGADALPYIPSRFDEGYGLSEQALDGLMKTGAKLVITVDCGIRDRKLIQKYKKKGLEFVTTDHHTLPDKLPDSIVVHPNHPEGEYPFQGICGTTVAWKLAQVLVEESGVNVDVGEYLDLVAMATVCDVMPLVDENRAIVKLGLERMRVTRRQGLQALMSVAGVKQEDVKAYHFGFHLGPRLNAAGRLESALTALRLLSTEDAKTAMVLAQQLQKFNLQRQDLTLQLLREAESLIASLPPSQKLFFIHADNWPEGVLGLVAGRLTEKYGRPVLVGTRASNGHIKGSARSIPAFHIADALGKHDKLLEQYGGHAQAAGFTVSVSNVEALKEELLSLAEEQLTVDDLQKELVIDVIAQPDSLTVDEVAAIDQLEPFGFGNPNPVIALMQNKISNIRRFGKQAEHIAFRFSEAPQIEAVSFGNAPLWGALKPGDIIDIAGNPSINSWNGRDSVQIKLRDIRPSQRA